jgi:hypothetical protein
MSLDECCIICNDTITNSFSILTCNCKNVMYHITCIETWFRIHLRCPTCNYKYTKNPFNTDDDVNVNLVNQYLLSEIQNALFYDSINRFEQYSTRRGNANRSSFYL